METLKEKILVIQTAFLGDAVLTLPLIQKLSEIFPQSLIDVIAIPATEEIFSASPYVSSVFVLDKKGRHKGIKRLIGFISELKKNNYTKLYSPHRSFRSGLITLGLGVKDSYGFDTSSFKFAYKTLVKYNLNDHEVKRNLSLVSNELNNDDWKILPEVELNETSTEKIKNYVSANNLSKGFIAVAPGSVWQTKVYPQEYFAEIAKELLHRNEKIVLIGGENDKNICDDIAFNLEKNVYVSAGEFTPVETIGLLKYSKLLITNDSAPTHLGMCADIPVITLYCSTVPGFGFYPYNNGSSYLSYDKLECKPCGIHGFNQCPVGTFDCGYKLKPETVIQKINNILGR